ncbi:MAG: hypothetical protein V1769_03705 [Thermoplasmatota archaeon]
MTENERTGWRDKEISHRHRVWGFNCPAVDLDFLMVEYNIGLPVALVEYKYFNAAIPNLKHPTYRALHALADSAQIQFYLAYYWPDIWAFKIIPINELSQIFYNSKMPVIFTERQYVEMMYRIRHRAIDEYVFKLLKNELPKNNP